MTASNKRGGFIVELTRDMHERAKRVAQIREHERPEWLRQRKSNPGFETTADKTYFGLLCELAFEELTGLPIHEQLFDGGIDFTDFITGTTFQVKLTSHMGPIGFPIPINEWEYTKNRADIFVLARADKSDPETVEFVRCIRSAAFDKIKVHKRLIELNWIVWSTSMVPLRWHVPILEAAR